MAPLLAGSLAQRDFEISGQRGRHSRAGRSVRAPAHLHLPVFVEQHACCSATPSTPIVLRRHSASQPAAGPTAAGFCFQCDERRVCELCLLAAGQPTRRTPHQQRVGSPPLLCPGIPLQLQRRRAPVPPVPPVHEPTLTPRWARPFSRWRRRQASLLSPASGLRRTSRGRC